MVWEGAVDLGYAATLSRRHLEGRKTSALVAFFDIRGFTPWSEAHSLPEIQTIAGILEREIQIAFGRTWVERLFLKGTGDGAMIVSENDWWDATNAMPHRAQFLLACGRTVEAGRQSLPSELAIGCGIDEGEVAQLYVLGRHDYLGSPINSASKLQSLAWNEICASIGFYENLTAEGCDVPSIHRMASRAIRIPASGVTRKWADRRDARVSAMSQETQTQAWVDAALKDVRQVMNGPGFAREVVNAKSKLPVTADDTSGPNFIAAAAVLMALESIARLATASEEGTSAATEFMKSEFPPEYADVAHLVWTLFRHGHIHNFLPQDVTIANVVVRGRVMWIMPSPMVDDLTAALSANRAGVLSQLSDGHLEFTRLGIDEYVFNFYPQIAYVDLVAAVTSWRAKLASSSTGHARFVHAINVVERMRRLTPSLQGPIANVLRSKGMIPK